MTSASSQDERLIVIDWGTSNFRAFLVDSDSGEVLDIRRSASGLRALSQDEFPHYCASQIQDWRRGDGAASGSKSGTSAASGAENGAASGAKSIPIYLAGMVGSARGWAEAPQLELPVSAAELADHVIAAPGLDDAWIVPGVKQVTAEHVDVMRGEEVQAFGALALSEAGADSTSIDCCLPGTHSKWAHLDSGRMTGFTTLMTGELYHAVRFHTLPGEPAREEAPFDEPAFRLGLSRAGGPGGVMHALFEGRSRHLYAGLDAHQVGSFLSGVLIGEEVRAMRDARPQIERVNLVGAESLRRSYTLALEAAGLEVNAIDSDRATLAGVLAIAQRHRAHWRANLHH
ncbi:2-dehydro-3-deoxygalactonokinase [Salinicola rhizosphaerae]|uniref:2-dehydro-3-deoxygalactonokinase n=1 Tax=Salinicola rhizosphaerae TaxID=1443141 RepID=A0ABQ3E749_9GAMM|nr:2-dehydro-3-deoxygalactonokinase [Salinicola rhizosphaerae]GHB25303.1 2-dehydro-3-deoxygalactonokinase [Salinicola rhizosphaerae]